MNDDELAALLAGLDPVAIARGLIGAEIVTTVGGEETALRITETEAYRAPDDQASHAANHRRTARTEVFYRPGGTAYVYLCYGIHEMFNVVTGPAGTPHAVLIRAGEPSRGLEVIRRRRGKGVSGARLSSGPGVVSRALAIDRSMNGLDLLDPAGVVRLRPGPAVPAAEVVATRRIGIDYAGEPWTSRPWRFIRRGSAYLSGPKKLNEG